MPTSQPALTEQTPPRALGDHGVGTPEEKAAAAQAGAATVARLNDTVEDVSTVIRGRVAHALRLLGPAAAAPMAAVDTTHRGVHQMVRHGSRITGLTEAASLTDSPSARTWLATLGAVFGDQLPPPLAPALGLHAPADVGQASAVAIFVHGLGGHEHQWSTDYAKVCAAADMPPVFARYTTGQSVDDYANQLAEALQHLTDTWTGAELRRIVLVGHSMGGLVATRALQLADAETTWPRLVSDLITLGSPLTGAPLERVSSATLDTIIDTSPAAAPIAELGHHRSAGIKDLGIGVHDAVPAHVRHVAVVAALGARTDSAASRLLGDGIVAPTSARGPHHFAPGVQAVELPKTHHLGLLDHPAVTDLLAEVVTSGFDDQR